MPGWLGTVVALLGDRFAWTTMCNEREYMNFSGKWAVFATEREMYQNWGHKRLNTDRMPLGLHLANNEDYNCLCLRIPIPSRCSVKGCERNKWMDEYPTSSIPLFPGLGHLTERSGSWSTGCIEGAPVRPRVQGLAKCFPKKNPDPYSYVFNTL